MVDDLFSTIPLAVLPKKIGRPKAGPICLRGHIDQRNASGSCKSCIKICGIEWVKNNREAANAKSRAWRQRNPNAAKETQRKSDLKRKDQKKAQRKVYYQANKIEILQRGRESRSVNKEKVRQRDRNKRARLRLAEGTHSHTEILFLLSAQRSKCAWCRTSIKAGYHADHIMPLAKGGSNWIRNIQLLCAPCNVRKRADHPIVWAQKEGRLL